MIDNENDKFYLVANAKSQAGIPVCFLTNPPKAVHVSEEDAEKEALRLAKLTGERFFVLEAKAYIEVKDGHPLWVDV